MDRNKIAELREKRAKLHDNMTALLAEAGDTGLRAEDAEKYDRMEADFDALTRSIKAGEKLLGINPERDMRSVALPDEDELREFGIDPDTVRMPESRADTLGSDDYREAFGMYLRRGFVPRSAGDELRAALQVGTDSEGGYTVPTEFFRQLVQNASEFGVIRQLAFVFSTGTGATLEIPSEATKGSAAWTAEEGAYNESEPTFGQSTLGAHKATREVVVSKELLQDSAFDLEAYIRGLAAESFALLENTAFVDGDGSGKPTGFIDNIPAGNVHTGANGQTTSVTTDDLIDVTYEVKRVYRARAAWVLNDATEKAVRKLKDANDQYIWQPGLQAGTPDTLLGRPVYADPDMPVMAANARSIVFGDFKGYWIRDVSAMSIQRLNEVHARNGQVGFLFDKRVDGKLIHAERLAAYANSAA
jgi:HK97 family phage major capsid protein